MIITSIKRIIPTNWYKYFLEKKMLSKKKALQNVKLSDRFIEYYNTNHWGGKESLSGKGSDSSQTKILIVEIKKLLTNISIKSILDIPCGDYNWMKNIDLLGIHYIGGDIVPDLISKNKDLYANKDNVKFEVMDITTAPLPTVDLIICRDCLVHLSYEDIFNSISNIKKSNCKFLLTTSFIDQKKNHNITNGDWRPINLEKKPFLFPKPQLIINENCTEDNGKYRDKSMCLWKISDIK